MSDDSYGSHCNVRTVRFLRQGGTYEGGRGYITPLDICRDGSRISTLPNSGLCAQQGVG